jgi:hypothetical protein
MKDLTALNVTYIPGRSERWNDVGEIYDSLLSIQLLPFGVIHKMCTTQLKHLHMTDIQFSQFLRYNFQCDAIIDPQFAEKAQKMSSSEYALKYFNLPAIESITCTDIHVSLELRHSLI